MDGVGAAPVLHGPGGHLRNLGSRRGGEKALQGVQQLQVIEGHVVRGVGAGGVVAEDVGCRDERIRGTLVRGAPRVEPQAAPGDGDGDGGERRNRRCGELSRGSGQTGQKGHGEGAHPPGLGIDGKARGGVRERLMTRRKHARSRGCARRERLTWAGAKAPKWRAVNEPGRAWSSGSASGHAGGRSGDCWCRKTGEEEVEEEEAEGEDAGEEDAGEEDASRAGAYMNAGEGAGRARRVRVVRTRSSRSCSASTSATAARSSSSDLPLRMPSATCKKRASRAGVLRLMLRFFAGSSRGLGEKR